MNATFKRRSAKAFAPEAPELLDSVIHVIAFNQAKTDLLVFSFAYSSSDIPAFRAMLRCMGVKAAGLAFFTLAPLVGGLTWPLIFRFRSDSFLAFEMLDFMFLPRA